MVVGVGDGGNCDVCSAGSEIEIMFALWELW